MLRSYNVVISLRDASRGVGSHDDIRIVSSVHNGLFDIHVWHLKDKSEGIDRIDVPIVTHFEHIILKSVVYPDRE